MRLVLATGFILVCALGSCRKRPDNTNVILSYSERHDFCGDCPSYRVDFFETGRVSYECLSRCAAPGEQHHFVPKERFRKLVEAFQAADFFSIPRVDPKRLVVDVPIIKLTYRDDQRIHEVVDTDRQEPRLEKLKSQMKAAIDVDRYFKPSVAMYQQLLDNRWNVNALDEEHQNALYAAVLLNEPNSIHFLVQHGSKITERTLTVAASSGRADLLRELLAAAHIKPTDPMAGTLIATAARGREPEALEFLLAWGADVNARDPDQDDDTPLLAAVKNGSTKNVELLLLKKGLDVNARDRNGATALVPATTHSDGSLNLLLQRGADPNLQDRNGATPLMHASYACLPEATRALLAAGADPRIADARGKTALRNGRVAEPKCNEVGEMIQEAWNSWSVRAPSRSGETRRSGSGR